MARDVHEFFSGDDLGEIERAVKAAELRTSGEIVPYAVGRCNHYEVALWKAATLGALLGAVAAAIAFDIGGFWGQGVPLWIVAPPAAGAAIGFLLAALLPAVKRLLIPKEELAAAVASRASAAFLEQEVFKTRERTGILIFVALFERRVAVLGDSGINAKVEQGDWDAVVAEIVAGIRAGRPGAALARGIEMCGSLLERHRVERRTDDTDELDDRLRFREE